MRPFRLVAAVALVIASVGFAVGAEQADRPQDGAPPEEKADTVTAAEPIKSADPVTKADAEKETGAEKTTAREKEFVEKKAAQERAARARATPDEPDPTAEHSNKSVSADLKSREALEPALFQVDLIREAFPSVYNFKQHIEDTLGLKFGMDYTTLSQWSSNTEDGQDFGMSQVLRALGTWRPIRIPGGARGELVWKTETRTSLGGNPTPRDLGFNSGSALSTANFKELRYWGVTDLYWKHLFQNGKFGLLIGHMDPGDWADQYSLLNAWTSFMNDAFYNNPTEAIPSRGFGIVGQLYTERSLYLLAGIHDANGGDGRLDWKSFWDGSEYFTWAEVGLRGQSGISARNNTHLHFWHQDAREVAGTEESWGSTFTHSFVTGNDGVAFLRAGYSEGDAPQMRRFIGGGYSTKVFDRDRVGVATSWGSPPDKSRRDQVTSEIFYRLQVTENMTISPDVQLVYQPSYTDDTDWLVMPGVRVRIEF